MISIQYKNRDILLYKYFFLIVNNNNSQRREISRIYSDQHLLYPMSQTTRRREFALAVNVIFD